jgi:uncharacterized protein (AIM24 family)
MEKEKIGYKVFVYGGSMEIIELELDPGQRIPARTIFDKWIDDGITYEKQALNNGKPDKGFFGTLFNSGKKKLHRDHLPVTYFANPSSGRKRIAFAVPHKRQILPIPLSTNDGDFICHKDTFICTDSGIELFSMSGSGTVYLQSKPYKMPKHAHSLTRDIRELANTKALQLYKGNLKKIKSFQWSKLQDLLKTNRFKNSLKKKIIPQGRTNKKR